MENPAQVNQFPLWFDDTKSGNAIMLLWTGFAEDTHAV